MSMSRSWLLVLVIIISKPGFGQSEAGQSNAGLREIRIDAGKVVGTIRSFHGVNGGAHADHGQIAELGAAI